MASQTFHETGKKNQAWENAKDAGKDAVSKGKEAGEQALEAAKEEGKETIDKVKDAGGAAMDKAKEAVQSVGTMASETACMVGQKAEQATAAAGHGIADFGDKIAQQGPQSGFAGAAAHKVGETIKEGGRYIEEQKLSGMARDVESVIKNHPIPALLAVFGIGFILGHALKESR
jgi:ElaB/YqjD/DUF883 family membrane-anchored ribosome-binding protein